MIFTTVNILNISHLKYRSTCLECLLFIILLFNSKYKNQSAMCVVHYIHTFDFIHLPGNLICKFSNTLINYNQFIIDIVLNQIYLII